LIHIALGYESSGDILGLVNTEVPCKILSVETFGTFLNLKIPAFSFHETIAHISVPVHVRLRLREART
jgi:hypothetical protein